MARLAKSMEDVRRGRVYDMDDIKIYNGGLDIDKIKSLFTKHIKN